MTGELPDDAWTTDPIRSARPGKDQVMTGGDGRRIRDRMFGPSVRSGRDLHRLHRPLRWR